MRAIEQQVIACIHAEKPGKVWEIEGATPGYCYALAARLGYSSMLVSTEERQALREMRGVAHRFKKQRRAA